MVSVMRFTDWMHEESAERVRKQLLRSQLGLRGLVLPVLDSWRMWAVLILTGVSIGYTGGMLDLLVAWYVLYDTSQHRWMLTFPGQAF